MRDPAANLVRKLWQYCNVLRDDGLSYPDYVEQLTYLLFLKMSDEQHEELIPIEYAWESLVGLDTKEMYRHYEHILQALGQREGMLGLIFHNAKNKIRDPAKLRLLIVDLIGQNEWSGLPADLKGDAYEALLEKNARDTKSGAGQYFTPRPLIEAIVKCTAPRLGELICDPACGTAGFLLAAHDHLSKATRKLTKRQQTHLRTKALRGFELVEEVARLAAMNLFLHGISGESQNEIPIICGDSLKTPPSSTFDVILTNPPFGVKGSVTYSGTERRNPSPSEDLTIVRPDFWAQTANKQLNFIQHIVALLKPGGRAAVVIPDNVLFEAGAAAAIRRRLLESCNVHTLLRLPTGLFYAAGVKANVIFFDKRSPQDSLWVYDLRSDHRFTLKTNPLQTEDLNEFVACYQADNFGRRERLANSRWQRFERTTIIASEDARLDISWAPTAAAAVTSKDGLSRLDELSIQIADDLDRALAHIRRIRRD